LFAVDVDQTRYTTNVASTTTNTPQRFSERASSQKTKQKCQATQRREACRLTAKLDANSQIMHALESFVGKLQQQTTLSAAYSMRSQKKKSRYAIFDKCARAKHSTNNSSVEQSLETRSQYTIIQPIDSMQSMKTSIETRSDSYTPLTTKAHEQTCVSNDNVLRRRPEQQ
jgi:hypothetical protein